MTNIEALREQTRFAMQQANPEVGVAVLGNVLLQLLDDLEPRRRRDYVVADSDGKIISRKPWPREVS